MWDLFVMGEEGEEAKGYYSNLFCVFLLCVCIYLYEAQG